MPASSRTLDGDRLAETLGRLRHRIEERFPCAGLGRVCGELVQVAATTAARAARITRPAVLLRIGVLAALAAGVAGFVWLLSMLDLRAPGQENVVGLVQGLEAGFNIAILLGATVLFLVTAERRLKRARALAALHELRAIIHVIDMHQLTKDPSSTLSGGSRTASSPKRDMTPFELTRYLDYCSEMLSLSAKVAALYAQALPDSEVVAAVADIEQLTTNLSHKIWQKIAIIAARGAPAAPLGAAP